MHISNEDIKKYRYLTDIFTEEITLEEWQIYTVIFRVEYMGYRRPPLWSSGQSSWLQIRRCIVFPVRYELNLCMLCRRK
jgi:hypothetical protein